MTAMRNAGRNALSGFRSAYGGSACVCLVYQLQQKYAVAPHLPDVSHGLLVPHNEHGTIRYFSAFQGTSCVLLLVTSIPLSLLGHLVGPKKNKVTRRRRTSISAIWDRDDPGRRWPVCVLCCVLGAPIIIFLVGPSLVRCLNAVGIVTGF